MHPWRQGDVAGGDRYFWHKSKEPNSDFLDEKGDF